jgi:D-serine deaminase-like pyridoxal phosphate-dependent protein
VARTATNASRKQLGGHRIEVDADGFSEIDDQASIPTPALVINGDRVRRNLASMSAYTKAHGLKLRPHTKTHKSLELARHQVNSGSFGLTVAKVSEATIMAEATDDLLLGYPVVDLLRARRIVEIARLNTMRVAIDSVCGVETLSQAAESASVTVGVLVDIDIGHHRTGVQSPEASLALALEVNRSRGLRLDGMFCFPGHIIAPPSLQAQELSLVSGQLQEAVDLWKRHGLEAAIVSGGSTPTAYQSHLIPQLTEIRPGTYVFNDMNTVRGHFCTLDDCSARIIATVVSDAVPGQVAIDAGSKTLTESCCIAAPESGYGYVIEYPAARIATLNEEHGLIDIRACNRPPTIGERITIIPNHICPCVNLQEYAWWIEPDENPRLINVDARGKLL